ncbi:hypothetical protein ACTFIW_000105 [Dictyostelium discoideum]
MLEVLKLKEALSEEQFAESKQEQWFTWIRKSVQTISNAREIKQIRNDSTKKSNFNQSTNTNTNNTVNTQRTTTPSQTQGKPQNQRQHTKSNGCFALGGQAPELLAIRIKIAEKWCTAIFDTGCTHSIIHPKLVKDNMKRTNCYAKIITPILAEPYASKSQVNVKFNLECDSKAEVQFKMYVAKIPYHAILGMDFINGVDMSNTNEGQWLIKYFKDSNELVRTTIPLYKYPIAKNTILRKIKAQVGTNTDFKLTNIQKLNLLSLDYDKPKLINPSVIQPPSPSIQPTTTQNTEEEDKRMKDEAHKILNKYKDIFVEQIPKFEPPFRQGFDMEVKVAEGSLQIKRSYNKMSEEESNKIEVEIKRLFEIGVIEESISSYSAPVFIAANKGKDRVVFDYRGVNKQTEEFAFPMPNGEEILKATNCKYFSVVDAKAGFHLLQVKKEHRTFTAFSFKGKLYQFRRAPFGMKNSPAYFNKWIQSIIEEFKEFARAYVDDIIIFSKTLEDHFTHVNKVLEKLRREKVTKAELFKDSVKFFGHVVSRDGFKPVLDKVEAINNLSEPTTVTEIRSFLGSCNYLRRFIPNYSELTARLAALTGTKTTRITITDEMRDDIKLLKKAITSSSQARFQQIFRRLY